MMNLNNSSFFQLIMPVVFLFFLLLVISNSSAQDLPDVCKNTPVLFEHNNFDGSSIKLSKSVGNLKLLNFVDKASSLCVPDGWEIVVYKGEGYCFPSHKITGPVLIQDLNNLSATNKKWNDSINSAKVVPNNFLDTPFGELVVKWAGVVDNAEEAFPPHGPYGNLHVLIYEPNQQCPGDQKDYPTALRHVVLPGPTPTGKKCEWDDGDQKQFDSLGIFQWRSKKDQVLVFIYESDGRSHGKDWDHDQLFCQVINRDDTLSSKVFESSLTVEQSALDRAESRDFEDWIDKYKSKGKNVKKMYIELETLPVASTYNYRISNTDKF